LEHYVDIYCKPYVAHYLKVKFKEDGKGYIDLPKSNLKQQIHSCLGTKFYPSDTFKKKGFDTYIRIKLTGHEVTKFGHSVNICNHYYLNSLIEGHIKSELAVLISIWRVDGLTWSQAIRKFQQKYGYTDEVFDFKTIERSYERSRAIAKK